MRPYFNPTLGYYEASDDQPIQPGDIQVPARPGDQYSLNAQKTVWVLPVASARKSARQSMLASYRAAVTADIALPAGIFPTDSAGKDAIVTAAITVATADPAAPATVALMDTSDALITLDKPGLVALWSAIQARDAAARAHLRDVLAAIKAAPDAAAVAAVVW
jgi:hypothetical protein